MVFLKGLNAGGGSLQLDLVELKSEHAQRALFAHARFNWTLWN